MNDQQLEEMYRLVRENNKMLHAQRRGAFLGGIVKILVWCAMIGVPIWLYLTYLAPVMQTALTAAQQIQAAGSNAQTQISGAQDALKKLQEQLQNIIPQQ